MPIVDIELVCQTDAEFSAISARALADTLGRAMGSEAGHTWVRLRFLGSQAYAENEVSVDAADLPVFVTVLQAKLPAIPELAAEVKAITAAVAACVGRSPERVHVQYAPAAAGRQAFGGRLVQ